MMMRYDLPMLLEMAKTVRKDVLKMTHAAGSGHPGGSLSAADFATALYFGRLQHDPHNPDWDHRDRVIFSKGHVAPLLYSLLARCDYFPVEDLPTLRKLDSHLQGHPSIDCPGVEVGTGSLGQGLSIGVGLAIAGKKRGIPYRTYVILGDGEIQEGQIWEAAMSAAHYKLDNLCAFVDYNNLQIDGCVSDVMEIANVYDKWRSFGWHVIKCDAHDMQQVLNALDEAQERTGKPSVIIGKTIKGKGVSFMEDDPGWHGKAPNDEELEKALAEIDGKEVG